MKILVVVVAHEDSGSGRRLLHRMRDDDRSRSRLLHTSRLCRGPYVDKCVEVRKRRRQPDAGRPLVGQRRHLLLHRPTVPCHAASRDPLRRRRA